MDAHWPCAGRVWEVHSYPGCHLILGKITKNLEETPPTYSKCNSEVVEREIDTRAHTHKSSPTTEHRHTARTSIHECRQRIPKFIYSLRMCTSACPTQTSIRLPHFANRDLAHTTSKVSCRQQSICYPLAGYWGYIHTRILPHIEDRSRLLTLKKHLHSTQSPIWERERERDHVH